MAGTDKAKQNASAGIVLFRRPADGTGPVEILLVHPGGPYWAKKDAHGWSIPKGEYDPGTEDPETAAVREFAEETGHPVPVGPRLSLPAFKAGRKTINAWLIEGDLDPESIESNTFEMEWPPKSGRIQAFPEVDRAGWFSLEEAETRLHKGQSPLCGLIEEALSAGH